MVSIVKSRFALAALASCAVVTTSPALATTITVNGSTESYHSDSPNGPFAFVTGVYNGSYASVGHIISGLNNPVDGYYASLMQFVLPTIPAKAVVKDVELTFSGLPGDRSGDIMMTVYSTQGTGFDPAKIGSGAKYGVIHPIGEYTLDVTYVIGNQLASLPAGSTAGFSFKQIAENCTFLQSNNTCFNILGSTGGGAYPIPTLSITYDEVTTAVPEPSTWALMMIGFGLVGGAMWRRRSHLAIQP
jgi:hypothetical protein